MSKQIDPRVGTVRYFQIRESREVDGFIRYDVVEGYEDLDADGAIEACKTMKEQGRRVMVVSVVETIEAVVAV